MTQTKSLPNTAYQTGPLLSAREEAERFAVAAARFRERAQKDPAYAEQMLRNIGYYEMMEQQRQEEREESQLNANGSHSNGSESSDSPQISEALQR